ncbi:unnamed protein product [Cladocopium goreaui]|uniref:Uncharacterized protein n=1 Tax=Cladocopium goreaui TaxID=2562237 RepID=A0A9P1CM08_9DINO|nr:unnamed protein product [Cladocopium goreaui]
MESDVPAPFLEHLRSERDRRPGPRGDMAEEFELDPSITAAGGTTMVMATMAVDWSEKHGQHGTDHLAQVWATMLESGSLTAKTFAVLVQQMALQGSEQSSNVQQLFD